MYAWVGATLSPTTAELWPVRMRDQAHDEQPFVPFNGIGGFSLSILLLKLLYGTALKFEINASDQSPVVAYLP